jgi:hypothetical protein
MKKIDLKNPKSGDLKVWWIPQVPMKAFEYPVNSVQEGFILLDALGMYDDFQFKNNIKPDYCNVGGLSVFDEGDVEEVDGIHYDGWSDWCSDMGDDINFYLREENGLELLNNDLKAE